MLDYLTLMVDGMTWEGSKASLEDALRKIDGVMHVEVDLEIGMVLLSFEAGKLTYEDIKKAIEDEGYQVTALL